MTTTQNLHLPQWEETDRIMRTDFNDAFAAIDAALAGAAKIAYGSYNGAGAGTLSLNFSFTPRFIAILGENGYVGATPLSESGGVWPLFFSADNGTGLGGKARYTLTGGAFLLDANGSYHYAMNVSGVLYHYFAIG